MTVSKRRFTAEHSPVTHKGGVYDLLFIAWDDRRMQISVSPTGRSVQVFLDGKKLVEVTDE